jgi:hypothetical protein
VKQHGRTRCLHGGANLGALHFITLLTCLVSFHEHECLYSEHNLLLEHVMQQCNCEPQEQRLASIYVTSSPLQHGDFCELDTSGGFSQRVWKFHVIF